MALRLFLILLKSFSNFFCSVFDSSGRYIVFKVSCNTSKSLNFPKIVAISPTFFSSTDFGKITAQENSAIAVRSRRIPTRI